MLQEVENLVNISYLKDAFDKFMTLESGTYDATYLRPCQMALANQLKNHNSLNYPKRWKKRFVEIMLMPYLITDVIKHILKKLGLLLNYLRRQVISVLAQQVIFCVEFDLSNKIYSDT